MKLETFSYLPPMTEAQVRKQVAHILGKGLIPAVEYTAAPRIDDIYWTMWELPLIDAKTVDDVMKELEACHTANPGAYIKVVGYDKVRQCQVVSFVAHRPGEAA